MAAVVAPVELEPELLVEFELRGGFRGATSPTSRSPASRPSRYSVASAAPQIAPGAHSGRTPYAMHEQVLVALRAIAATVPGGSPSSPEDLSSSGDCKTTTSPGGGPG